MTSHESNNTSSGITPLDIDNDNITGTGVWNEEEWIQCGQTWSDVPDVVKAERACLCTVPEEFLVLLPKPTNTHIIPTWKSLQDLENSLGQSWFDGTQSIHSTQTDLSLPFWVLTFFGAALKARTNQIRWATSLEWVHNQASLELSMHDSIELVELTLVEIPWCGPIPGVRTDGKIEDLWRLLGDNALDSAVLDAMLKVSALWLEEEDPNSMIKIATTEFSNAITFRHNMDRMKAYLDKFQRLIQSKRYSRILVVVHYPVYHWGACLIDFEHCIVNFGDGLRRDDEPFLQF
ncbi:hypothetical protein K435DRAFT_797224 [Dendrothele bispora CBS 962.96]|uniref:Ubiquitin-like protease family profile domain-containing protein n=1 Tax=Dendrothele bispora (strain CBS 962.96) TaxID=1314807 RepID=A0A4S8M3P6_DENBC|nr:hypothetical protein K435DRAFT_797224 [Dendrothele bispora CBS 962.96]